MWKDTNCIINKIDPREACGTRRRNYINKTNDASCNLELGIDRKVDGEFGRSMKLSLKLKAID